MKKVRDISLIVGLVLAVFMGVLLVAATDFGGFFTLVSNSFGAAIRLFNGAWNPRKIAVLAVGVVLAIVVIVMMVMQVKNKKPVFAPVALFVATAMILGTIWKLNTLLSVMSGAVHGMTAAHGLFFLISWFGAMIGLLVYAILGFTVCQQEVRKEKAAAKEAAAKAEEPKAEEEKVEEAPVEQAPVAAVAVEDPSKYAAQDEVVLGASVAFVSGEHTLKATITELDGEVLENVEPDIVVTRKMVVDYVAAMEGENHPVATVIPEKKSERSPDSLNLKSCNMALVYGKDGSLSVLMRLPEDVAKEAKEAHTVEDSNFAGTKDYYKVSFAAGWKKEEDVYAILEAAYAYVLSKYFYVENGEYVALEEEAVEAPVEEEVIDTKYEAQSEVVVGEEVTFVSGEHTVIAQIIELDGERLAEEEAPVEEPAAEEEAEEAEEAEEVELDENGFPTIKSKPFTQKFEEMDQDLRDKYSVLKNALLSHKKVHSRISKGGDTFNYGRNQVAKITIVGKHIRLYLALDPNGYENSKYHHADASDKKKYADVPMMMKIKSNLSVKNSLKLIEDVCAKVEAPVNAKYEQADYSSKDAFKA